MKIQLLFPELEFKWVIYFWPIICVIYKMFTISLRRNIAFFSHTKNSQKGLKVKTSKTILEHYLRLRMNFMALFPNYINFCLSWQKKIQWNSTTTHLVFKRNSIESANRLIFTNRPVTITSLYILIFDFFQNEALNFSFTFFRVSFFKIIPL